jgi:hypothetical protein
MERVVEHDSDMSDMDQAPRPQTRDDFLAALADCDAPEDFLDESERRQSEQDRDPFADWPG